MKYQKKESLGAPFAKKGVDIKDGDYLEIANEGIKRPNRFDPETDQDVFLVKLSSGEEKNVNLNQTSLNNLIDAFGEDSINWVGKRVKAWIMKDFKDGKLQHKLFLSHPDAELTNAGFVIPGQVAPADEIRPDDIPF